jgi:hypothetical protein
VSAAEGQKQLHSPWRQVSRGAGSLRPFMAFKGLVFQGIGDNTDMYSITFEWSVTF